MCYTLVGCIGGWEGCCSAVVVLTLKGHQSVVISHKLEYVHACELPSSDARLTGAGCCAPHTVQVWKQGTVSRVVIVVCRTTITGINYATQRSLK